MNKKWNILNVANSVSVQNWSINKKEANYSNLLLSLLYNRGIKTKQQIDNFLNLDDKEFFDPFLFNNMENVIDLIIKHIKNKSKIFIYGDYDADGITSSAVLCDLLEIFNVNVNVYIPDRIKEGYGMNKKAIDKISSVGGKLIITVDTGIKNVDEVEYAKKQGIDVIITDHHGSVDALPDCLIINPAIKGEKYPFKYLAGVGVAFKVASALIRKSKLDDNKKQTLKNNLLDLVAIGTVADCVTLFDENRLLVKRGLKVLNNTKRIGLQELIKVSGISKKIDSWNIGFQIAPRINASSRIMNAEEAFLLLISKDRQDAKKRADILNQRNAERQKQTINMLNEIIAELEEDALKKAHDNKIIISVNNKIGAWSEGVIGLVSGRVKEKYYKPSLVITKTENGYKGSGRSIEGFNIVEAIEACSDLLEKYGGHPMACGFSVSDDNLDKFKKKIIDFTNKKLKNKKLVPKLNIDLELDIHDINNDTWLDIQKLAPYGQDNLSPVFVSKNVEIKDLNIIGKEQTHIKFYLNGIWAIAFNWAKKCENFKIGDKIDLAYTIDMNDFNGDSSLQLKIIDLKKV